MRCRVLLAGVLFSLLPSVSFAQVAGSGWGNVRVHVVYSNDRHAPMHLLVHLMASSSGSPTADGYTNDLGVVNFSHVSVGTYHLEISGEGVRTTTSEQFEVDSRKVSQTQFVTVHRNEEGNSSRSEASSAMVNANELNVPESARKQFDKGTEAMGQQDWKKALERLNKAIAIYPNYAAAYNNLGVVYSKMNDPAHEREALLQAISLDDHFASAYVNLAVLCIRQQDFRGALGYLEKSIPLDPNNPRTLLLLANMELMNKNFDAAIAAADKIHALPHENMALAHYIAARAYERENRLPEAKAELQAFLKEEPNGARADHVREELKLVDQNLH